MRTNSLLAMDLANLIFTKWGCRAEDINLLSLKEAAQEVIKSALAAGKSVQDGVTADTVMAETLKTYSTR